MELRGRAYSIVGDVVTFVVDNPEEFEKLAIITTDKYPEGVLKFGDGRTISDSQRSKAYAIMRDMSAEKGMDEAEIKAMMKKYYAIEMNEQMFSLANTDMTTARQFISFLLEWCFTYDIPLKQPGSKYHDDEDRYQYICLKYRKCVICNKPDAQIHHADKVGINMRHLVDHRAKRLVALCAEHHQEAENMGWPGFSELYVIPGYYLDERTLNALGIMTYKKMREIDYDKQKRANWTSNE